MPNQIEENIPKKVFKEKYRKIKQKVKSVREKVKTQEVFQTIKFDYQER